MKTLILGTSYISAAQEGAQNYGAKLAEMWARLARHLNPDCDILIVDSASPINPADVLRPIGFIEAQIVADSDFPHNFVISDGAEDPAERFRRNGVLRFPDNIGHINTTSRDGWGRAFCKGVEYAFDWGYDYIAYCDVDILFARPVGPIIEKMARSGVKASCPVDTQYAFLENGLMFLDVAYLRDSDFIGRYNWPSRTRSADPMEIPEMVFERLMEDVLFTLPLRTYRDDMKRITPNNIEHAFPYGIDAITHMASIECYERFLEMKGIKL